MSQEVYGIELDAQRALMKMIILTGSSRLTKGIQVQSNR
jgi:hypothetical protein